MKKLLLFYLTSITTSSMILRSQKNKITPESNKLVLSLTPEIQLETKNTLKSFHSSTGQITIQNTPENKPHFQKIKKAFEKPLYKTEKNFSKNQKHIQIIEEDLKNALNTSKGNPIIINPHVLKTISSYLKNLEYRKKMNFEESVPNLPYGLKKNLEGEKKRRDEGYDAESKLWELEARIKEARMNGEGEEKIKNLENQLRDVRKDKEVMQEMKRLRKEKFGKRSGDTQEEEGALSGEDEAEVGSEEEVEGDLRKEGDHNEEEDLGEEVDHNEEEEHFEQEEIGETNEDLMGDLAHKEKIYADIVKIDERIMEIIKEIEEATDDKIKTSLTLEKQNLSEQRKELQKANEDTTITSIKSSIMVTDENNYTGLARNYKNIPNLLIIIQSISTVYNTLFQDIPENANKVPKSTLEQLKEGLLLYAKLRNFIIAITVNRDNLNADLIHLKNNIDSIELNHDEVLGFFDLNDRYVELLFKSDKLNKEFWERVTELKSETDSFSTTITKIAKNVNTLITLNSLIFEKTDYLSNNMDNDEIMDSIKKVDATLLVLPELIEIKNDLDVVFKELGEDFEVVKGKRERLSGVLDEMEGVKGVVLEAESGFLEGRMSGIVFVLGFFAFW